MLALRYVAHRHTRRSLIVQASITSTPSSSSNTPWSPLRSFTTTTPPPAAQLEAAAHFACLSGLAYRNDIELAQQLARKQLSLVAAGETTFTRWFVAEGALPSNDPTIPRTRALLLRGVDWRGARATGSTTSLWQSLSRCWPVPLLPTLTRPPEALLCHAGVADMAQSLWDDVGCYCSGDTGVVYAGYGCLSTALAHCVYPWYTTPPHKYRHSLGGALAVVLAIIARLTLDAPPPQCYTFGSPPVVTHSNAVASNDAALRALGLPPAALQHYVLDQDPVPRAMLSVDPTLSVLKQLVGLQPLLDAQRSMFGGTPARFLMDLPMGEVYLLKLDQQRVHRLGGDEAAQALEMPVAEMMAAPAKAIKALLDHSHSAYTQELRAAARLVQRREEQAH